MSEARVWASDSLVAEQAAPKMDRSEMQTTVCVRKEIILDLIRAFGARSPRRHAPINDSSSTRCTGEDGSWTARVPENNHAGLSVGAPYLGVDVPGVLSQACSFAVEVLILCVARYEERAHVRSRIGWSSDFARRPRRRRASRSQGRVRRGS